MWSENGALKARSPAADRGAPLLPTRATGPRHWLGALALMLLPLLPLLPLLASLTPARAQAHPAPDSFADLAERLQPAVVNISTMQTVKGAQQGATPGRQGRITPDSPQGSPGSPFDDFFHDFFDRQQQQQQQQGNRTDGAAAPRMVTSLGSGFIIDPSGLVVTNNHVIADADEITVTLQDNTSMKAELVGRDTKTDLALLRVKTDRQLPTVSFGDSNKERVGEWVLAIGNPFGFGGSVSAGIISARSRELSNGPYDDFLQTDAAINKGNSGGPLFNTQGDVIGVITAIISPSGGSIGIGFAIPSELASNVVGQLRQYGRARRGWLGVKIQNVNAEIAESLGLDKAKGAMVAAVSDNGPAQHAGIEAGDVVVTFDGRAVTDSRHLPRIVAETPIDKTVPVTVWRKRKALTLDVKVGELKEDEETVASNDSSAPKPSAPPPASVKALGLGLSAITPELREKFSLSGDASGAVVTDIAKDSPAVEKGIKVGDVIIEIAQEEVKTPQQIQARIEDARKSGRKSVLMLVDRMGDLRFIAVRIDQG